MVKTYEQLEKDHAIALAALRIAMPNIPCPNWGRQARGSFTSCQKPTCDGCWARHMVEWALSGVDPETEPHFKKRSEYQDGETI